jgi:hypothetical protein
MPIATMSRPRHPNDENSCWVDWLREQQVLQDFFKKEKETEKEEKKIF